MEVLEDDMTDEVVFNSKNELMISCAHTCTNHFDLELERERERKREKSEFVLARKE